MRPMSLVRSDSDAPAFSAPAVNIREELDCGIKNIPCCLPKFCHRFATSKWFLLFYVILAIVQGSTQAYFASTARHIGQIFGYSEQLLDWLIVSHDLFMGLFVFLVAFWGNKYHRPAWLGGLACLQGFSCFLTFIPYLDYKSRNETAFKIQDPPFSLCKEHNPLIINLELTETEIIVEFEWITLIVLFVAQFFTGLANASFFSHGFSYLDDNIQQSSSLLYITIGLAVRLSPVEYGSFMAWSILNDAKGWWIGYAVNGGLLIFAGIVVALFPRKLLDTIIKQTAESILDRASGNDRIAASLEPDHNFCRSFKRLITNKIVILNSLAVTFMLVAVYNFLWYEPRFMESQFYLPSVGVGFDDPWKSRLWKNITKPILMFLTILISGLIISRIKPKGRSVVIWNIVTTTIVAAIYLSYSFIDCHKGGIAGAYKGHLNTPYCSVMCNCKDELKFDPVCTQDTKLTYYSPCHAGCQETVYMGSTRVYGNCSCSSDKNRLDKIFTTASQGACDNNECSKQWIIFQTLTVLSFSLLGSGFLGSFFLNLRSIYSVDRAMVIGFQFFFIGIFTHIPAKIIYKAIADSTCQFYNYRIEHCNIHSEKFGDHIAYLTSGLLMISAILYFILVFFVKNVELFEDEDKFEYPDTPAPIETRPMSVLSTPSVPDSDVLRPLRPPRSTSTTSRASTRVNSIEFNNDPIATRDRAQRNVIDELQRLTGTPV